MSLVLLSGCAKAEVSYPWLSELAAESDVKIAGERLMALPFGLHPLEHVDQQAATLLIGVHGYASKGYEWIYPLATLDDDAAATHFFRWDYSGCPGPSADMLVATIGDILEKSPEIEEVRLLGHSYGGVLVATVMNRWVYETPVSIHTIAAPLAFSSRPDNECSYSFPPEAPKNITLSQWRTQHELDGAFKDLPEDPQVFNVAGSQVTRLPDSYRGKRLGHNWSISWVADTLVGKDDL